MSVLERGATSILIIACDFEKRRTNSSTPVRGEKPRFIQSSNSTRISHLRGQAFYRSREIVLIPSMSQMGRVCWFLFGSLKCLHFPT